MPGSALHSNSGHPQFQFLPTGAQHTDVIINWLIDGRVAESEVDVERMVWLWDVTTVQDKAIVEPNAAGVRSQAYVPGPYSLLEPGSAALVQSYLMDCQPKYQQRNRRGLHRSASSRLPSIPAIALLQARID